MFSTRSFKIGRLGFFIPPMLFQYGGLLIIFSFRRSDPRSSARLDTRSSRIFLPHERNFIVISRRRRRRLRRGILHPLIVEPFWGWRAPLCIITAAKFAEPDRSPSLSLPLPPDVLIRSSPLKAPARSSLKVPHRGLANSVLGFHVARLEFSTPWG